MRYLAILALISRKRLLAAAAGIATVIVFAALWLVVNVVRARALGRRPPRCPKCGRRDVGRSVARDFQDELMGVFSCFPYRCRDCIARFYRHEELRPTEITIR